MEIQQITWTRDAEASEWTATTPEGRIRITPSYRGHKQCGWFVKGYRIAGGGFSGSASTLKAAKEQAAAKAAVWAKY